MRARVFSGAILLVAVAGAAAWVRAAAGEPVYVGARVCGTCHDGAGMGYQFSLWLHSKHSQSYAALAKPEAQKILQLSGLRGDPQASPTCMGCHAPAALAEPWQKEESLRPEDGVQCEDCHGPGSEYMAEEVMRNPEAARAAGLKMPTAADCMRCHITKGSHVAVLAVATFDFESRMKAIAHPTPQNAAMGGLRQPSTDGGKKRAGPKYVGVAACNKCHRGPESGHQDSLWRMSPHARAWSVLATPRARELAKAKGLDGDPQQLPQCLECHSPGALAPADAVLASFSPDEGVGCEACHGPGSEYMAEAIMRDRRAARAAGLKEVGSQTCMPCHRQAHGKQYELKMEAIAHPTRPAKTASAEEPRYKTPVSLALDPQGRELYVTCSGSDSVIVVDARAWAKLAEIPVGKQPHGVVFSPDGRRVFVSNVFDDTVSVIDAAERKVMGTLEVGDEPHGLITDRQGKFLFVLNAAGDDVHVFELNSLRRLKKLAASRRPWAAAQSPDGARIAVTHTLPRLTPFLTPPVAELTIIEAGRAIVEDRVVFPAANLLKGVAWHPSGDYALVTLNRTKNLVPMTRLLQGWTITNGLGLMWEDGSTDQVLLDEPDWGFADPNAVAITPDGRFALITSGGRDRLAVVDLDKLVSLLRQASPYERRHVLPNHLGKPTEFVVKHIPLSYNPRDLLILPDGKTVVVVNGLDDSLSVVDLERFEVTGRIDLGGPREITKVRYGERLFHNAGITFRRQFSCATCHPGGHVDGLTYDIEGDGIGVNHVDNRTLRGILDTAPFKWNGLNPSLARQCGPRLAVFFTRIQPFTPDELSAVDTYIASILRPPNRFRTLGAELTPAQRRGRAIFERTRTSDGREIPRGQRCVSCHPAPYFTDRQLHDVGTRSPYDTDGKFDTPQLNNIYDSAPYLHNGMAHSLEEIWTVYNPEDKHGVTNDLTKDQLNDLIEYLKTL